MAIRKNGILEILFGREKKSNLIQVLNLTNDEITAIKNELMHGGVNAEVITSEFINKYFSDAKKGELHGDFEGRGFGEILLRVNYPTSVQQPVYTEQSIEQAALYLNLYPGAFKRLTDDMVEFFDTTHFEQPLKRIKEVARETDGPYEEMMRQSGKLVDPF